MATAPSLAHRTGFGLIRQVSASFIIKIVGAGMGFASAVIAARLLGATDAGIYFLAITIVTVVATLSRVGTDVVIVRTAASVNHDRGWGALKGVYRASFRLVMGAATTLTVALVITAPWLVNDVFGKSALVMPLTVTALAIVPSVLCFLYANQLLGLGRIRQATSLLVLWTPLFSLIAIPLLAFWFGVAGAAGGYFVASCATAFVAWWWFRSATTEMSNAPLQLTRKCFGMSCRVQFLTSLFQMVVAWMPTLVLGAIAVSADVGIYAVATRTAMLISFVAVPVNNVVAPQFAALHVQNDLEKLSALAGYTTRLAFVLAMPAVLVCIVGADQLLRIFGAEYTNGATILRILALSQFLSVVIGPVGTLLAMCGRESYLRNSIMLGAMVCVVASAVLIPLFGALGAAIVVVLVQAAQALALVYSAHRSLGVMPLNWARITRPALGDATRP